MIGLIFGDMENFYDLKGQESNETFSRPALAATPATKIMALRIFWPNCLIRVNKTESAR
jgi:hypothetical protein